MPEDKLRKIADCLEEEAFDDGQCIIKQVKTLSSTEIKTLHTTNSLDEVSWVIQFLEGTKSFHIVKSHFQFKLFGSYIVLRLFLQLLRILYWNSHKPVWYTARN